MSKGPCGCASSCEHDTDPRVLKPLEDNMSRTQVFDVPEGGWARILTSGIPEGEKLCLFERFCFCNHPDMEIPVTYGGTQIGIGGSCYAAIIPVGGQYFLEYSGGDIDFDVVVKPYNDVTPLGVMAELCCGD